MSKKKKGPEPFNNPFGELKLKPKAPATPAKPPPPPKPARKKSAEEEEQALFLEAVGAVRPVRAGSDRVGPAAPRPVESLSIPTEDAEALAELAQLVSGEGTFDLEGSDEFIEGGIHGLDPRVMRKLKAGAFSAQAHVDLHGLTRDEAKQALEAFIVRARQQGHRCVLVVHGRGLHSKDQVPVLKAAAQAWLTRGRLSKWVLAFCTAQAQDGGAGALYVLLRR